MRSTAPSTRSEVRRTDRYIVCDEIAAGGMATVHLGLALGAEGFSRVVAIKRMHPHVAREPGFAEMFLDEARLAARVRHPNVVATLDVVASEDGLFHVLELVLGATLWRLLTEARRQGVRPPPAVVAAIGVAMLHGLHAAHEAKSDTGEPLGLVHRDVSPQNVLVGAEGVARVLDFGVAKARARSTHTREGQLKGKLAYMSPEQIARGNEVDRRSDVFAAGVVTWELATGERLFSRDNEAMIIRAILTGDALPPSHVDRQLARFDDVVMTALATDPANRYPTAREMALALERACRPATSSEVAAWVDTLCGREVERLAARVEVLERSPIDPQIDALLRERDPGVERSGGTTIILSHQGGPRLAAADAATASVAGSGSAKRRSKLGSVAAVAVCVAGAAVAMVVTGEPSPEPAPVTSAAAAQPSAPSDPAPAAAAPEDAPLDVRAPTEASPARAAPTSEPVPPGLAPKRRATKPRAEPAPSPTAKRPSDFGF
jgi:serine/threonine-protein kinase